MLQLLFQNIERALGPSLSQVSGFVYWSGLIILSAVVLLPVIRVLMEYDVARAGMERYWVKTCRHCGKLGIVTGRWCDYCERDLGIPWPVRWWTAPSRRREGSWVRRLRWTSQLLWSVVFLLLSIWLLAGIGGFSPQGEVHRLFLGVALLAWAAIGWFAGGALRLGHRGLLGRARDTLIAFAAIGVMATALFLADAARPTPERSLARFTTEDGIIRFGEQQVGISKGQVAFEYLQLDHDFLGYHRIIPLGLSGEKRVLLPTTTIGRWVVNHLEENAGLYMARGLMVRERSDRVRVRSGQSYEVVERKGQVLIRKTGDSKT